VPEFRYTRYRISTHECNIHVLKLHHHSIPTRFQNVHRNTDTNYNNPAHHNCTFFRPNFLYCNKSSSQLPQNIFHFLFLFRQHRTTPCTTRRNHSSISRFLCFHQHGNHSVSRFSKRRQCIASHYSSQHIIFVSS
jgi:hypothetical protein